MNVRNLYPCQFEELREKLELTYSEDELRDIGADIDYWDNIDWNNWDCGNIPNELVIKSFDGYDFHCDDFFCTAGEYDEYPDREE